MLGPGQPANGTHSTSGCTAHSIASKPPRLKSANIRSAISVSWDIANEVSACGFEKASAAAKPESGRPDSNRHRELGRLLCDRYTTPAWSAHREDWTVF